MVCYLYNLMQRFLAGNSLFEERKSVEESLGKITAKVNYVF